MSTEVKNRRGTYAEHESFAGGNAEVTVETDARTLRIHDGVTPGGVVIGRKVEFSSLSEAVTFITPISNTYPLDTPITVLSRKSEAECITAGVSYPDDGASSYSITLTETPDNLSIIDVGDRQLKLTPTGEINVQQFNGDFNAALQYAMDNQQHIVVNGKKAVISDSAWNPEDDRIYARTTPNTALQSLGGHYDELGAAGRNYKWGHNSWFTNGGTMPLTCYSAVSQGWLVRSVDATSRQVGANGNAHSLEIISGQYSAKANVTLSIGSNTLVVDEVTFKGSRFCIGDVVSGTGIPLGSLVTKVHKGSSSVSLLELQTVSVASGGSGYAVDDIVTIVGGTYSRVAVLKVLSVSGGAITNALVIDGGDYTVEASDGSSLTGGSGTGATVNLTYVVAGYGLPTSIEIDNNATSNGTVAADFKCEANQNIGLLISGSGDGGLSGDGNENGRAIQIQAYGDAAYKYGVTFSGSGIRTDGSGMYGSFMDCKSLIELDSSDFESILDFNGVDCSDAAMKVQNMNANYGLRFHNSNSYTFAAIYLDGQDIGTDSTNGMRIATSINSKLGFWGKTPVVRPSKVDRPTGGVTTDAECRAQLDDLLDKLESIGILAT